MSLKIYIRGAYGPGNLGDDVLLVCMVNILKEVIKPCDIYVGVEDVKLADKLKLGVNLLHYKTPISVDVVVYGGGGQFFSFENSQKAYEKASFFSRLSYFISQNKNPYYAIKRLIYSRYSSVIENLIKTKFVASYSIGIGPFENDGKGFQRLREFSSKAGFISLRDEKSLSLYEGFFPDKDKPLLTADPSFYSPDWFINEQDKATGYIYDFTYIIREWPYSEYGRTMIKNMIESCRNKLKLGEKVRIVALFKEYDKNIIEDNKDLDWLVYDLNVTTMEDFLHDLVNGSKYIISARAHGVWLPTILGKPVLAVGIENKLEQVANSLKGSTYLSTAQSLSGLEEDIKHYVNQYDDLKANTSQAVDINKNTAISARKAFQEWLKNVKL